MTAKKYEVAIYNETVKTAVREGEKNRTGLSDDWGDLRYIEVMAENPEQARAKLHNRFPEARGFVITEIREI